MVKATYLTHESVVPVQPGLGSGLRRRLAVLEWRKTRSHEARAEADWHPVGRARQIALQHAEPTPSPAQVREAKTRALAKAGRKTATLRRRAVRRATAIQAAVTPRDEEDFCAKCGYDREMCEVIGCG